MEHRGIGEGVAQKGWGLAGFGVGEEPQESCGFITSNVRQLQSQRQQGGIADPGGVQGRCVPCSPSRSLELCLSYYYFRSPPLHNFCWDCTEECLPSVMERQVEC